MPISPNKRRLVVASTPNSLLSAILCLQNVKATNSPSPILAISSDYANRSDVETFEQALRDLICLYPWHDVIWFTGMRGMLGYHFAGTRFPSPHRRRRMNLNDKAIAAGIISAAENLYELAGETSRNGTIIEELWLEGAEYVMCRYIYSLLPRSRKVLYPHAPDFQTEWDQRFRRAQVQKNYRRNRWLPLRYRISETIFAEAVSQYRLKWDDICTLNESPSMKAPITDCSVQLEENPLRQLAGRLPNNRRRELNELAVSVEKDSTALLLLGNLWDTYLDEEIKTYKDLLTIAFQRKPIKRILVKAHPRHPVRDRDYIVQHLQEHFPGMFFEMLDGFDGLPIELALPFIPFCFCIAGWTSAITAVHKIKKVPILVGVSRLLPLVYATPDRKEMFEDFVNYLPKYAEVI